MKATIQNFRGVASATLDLSKIALIAGENGAGKSSICQAVAAALTGEAIPLPNVKKTAAGVLVRSGTAAGKIIVESPDGTVEVTWPAAKVKTTGEPPLSSPFAAGLKSIVVMDDKDRTAFLIQYLKAQPTKDDLAKSLATLGMNDQAIDRLWELIQSVGWDTAYAQIKEKGAKLKGQWELITNDNYGAKKADTWIPPNYEPELESASEETLRALVTDARDTLEAAIAAGAVDESKRAEWEELAGLLFDRQNALAALVEPDGQPLKDLEVQVKAARAEAADAKQAYERIGKELDELQNPSVSAHPANSYHCPECHTLLTLDKDLLRKVTKKKAQDPDQKAISAKEDEYDTAEGEASAAHDRMTDLEKQYKAESDRMVSVTAQYTREKAEAERLVKESEDAGAKLLQPASGSGQDVEQCRNMLAEAERRLTAYVYKRDADKIHKNIGLNQEILDKVAPTGVRADALTKALDGFNVLLHNHSVEAHWSPVDIGQDFCFNYGGTPYWLLSESEKFRVRTIVQLTMAETERAALVVIDGADILDKPGRNGLVRLLVHVGIPAVIGMTLHGREDVPNLAKAGYGISYWLDAAVAEEV